jgi:ribosome biogenesis GTPase A
MELKELKELMALKAEEQTNIPKLQSISEFYQELRNFVDNLNLYKMEFIENYIDAPLNKWYQLEQMSWLKDKCVVGIMGRYSTGKTTLMNSLLKLNLPTDSEANTALPTYIAYGKQTEFRILDANGEIKKIPESMIKMLDHEYSGNFPFSKIIQYIVLNQHAELLRKISFLDTPGISKDERDLHLTASVIDQCDVIFWLVSAMNGQLDAQTEIPFLKKYIANENLYIILTFTDQCYDVVGVKNTITQTLKKEDIAYKGILEFSRDELQMENSLEKIISTLQIEEEKFEAFQPITFLENVLRSINEQITELLTEATEKKNDIEKECTNYLNSIKNIFASLGSNLEYSTRELNSLTNTVSSRCSNVMFCNATYQQLQGNLNALINRYNSMINDYNNLDTDEIINFGAMNVHLETYESHIESLTESRNKCIELTNRLKKLFK